MKTKIFMTLFAIALAANVSAQRVFPTVNSEYKSKLEDEHQHKGLFFVGGAVNYWNDTKDKNLKFHFHPEFGYLFNEHWGFGLLLGYGYESSSASTTDISATSFRVSPFVRYYYFHKGPFNIYFDAGFGFNTIEHNQGSSSSSSKGFEIGIRPGACVDLTEGLCLCLRMGFLGYRKDYFSGEEEGLSNNGFGIRFAPEELSIGLELEF